MLQLKGITKNYLSGDNEVKALKGIDLEFRESEFVSILGQSGCGKTTMTKLINGLIPHHRRARQIHIRRPSN